MMVLVPSGNAHCGRIALSFIFRSLRALCVPVLCNHLLLSLHANRCDGGAVYRAITLRCIKVISVISVITFNPRDGQRGGLLAEAALLACFMPSLFSHNG